MSDTKTLRNLKRIAREAKRAWGVARTPEHVAATRRVMDATEAEIARLEARMVSGLTDGEALFDAACAEFGPEVLHPSVEA